MLSTVNGDRLDAYQLLICICRIIDERAGVFTCCSRESSIIKNCFRFSRKFENFRKEIPSREIIRVVSFSLVFLCVLVTGKKRLRLFSRTGYLSSSSR